MIKTAEITQVAKDYYVVTEFIDGDFERVYSHRGNLDSLTDEIGILWEIKR